MSMIISATPGPSGWRVRLRPAGTPEFLESPEESRAVQLGRAKLARLFNATQTPPSTWQLELTKSLLGEGELALGLAEIIADRCAANSTLPIAMLVPRGLLQLRTVVGAMRERGLVVTSAPFNTVREQVLCLAAATIGLAMMLWTIARCSLERRRAPCDRRIVIAVHGEDSNRTRHVLALLGDGDEKVRVIVLGRPRASLARLRKAWASAWRNDALELERPHDIAAAIAAAPTIRASLVLGTSLISGLPWLPGIAALSGTIYRECMGLVSAQWWQAAPSLGGSIIYGHTGLADTTHLELAQQASGCVTIHAVHGLSDGLNFVGRSNVAVFRCKHDAQWHERLGGYGKCQSVAMAQPAYMHGGGRLLLLSNYLHPMSLWFRMHGARDEIRALDEVSRAVELSSLGWSALVWRPHPVFSVHSVGLRGLVLAAAEHRGFYKWTEAEGSADGSQPAQVVCTPSSVAMDVMMAGSMPLVLDLQGMNPSCAIRRLPFVAVNAAELASCLVTAADPTHGEHAFAAAWRDIGPSGPLDLEALLQG